MSEIRRNPEEDIDEDGETSTVHHPEPQKIQVVLTTGLKREKDGSLSLLKNRQNANCIMPVPAEAMLQMKDQRTGQIVGAKGVYKKCNSSCAHFQRVIFIPDEKMYHATICNNLTYRIKEEDYQVDSELKIS